MKQYEFSARTENEAIEQGLQELGVSIADVDVQVVEEGSKGLFGLFGSRPVKVRLTLKDSGEDPLADLLEDKKPEPKAEKAEPAPKAEKAEASEEKAAKPEIRPMEKPEVTMIPAEELAADSPAGIAHAFLEELTRFRNMLEAGDREGMRGKMRLSTQRRTLFDKK